MALEQESEEEEKAGDPAAESQQSEGEEGTNEGTKGGKDKLETKGKPKRHWSADDAIASAQRAWIREATSLREK
eukprot:8170704-Lingulodinium_polyedra.AAC.1